MSTQQTPPPPTQSYGQPYYGMPPVPTLNGELIIFVLVLLRRVEHFILRRRRLYHYKFKTRDPASTLTKMLDLLEKEGMQMTDFDVRDAGQGEHEVNLKVVTSLNGNSRLIKSLPQLGTELQTSTHEETD